MLNHGRRPARALRALAATIAAGGLLVAAPVWAQGQPAQPRDAAPALGTATGKIQGRIVEKGKDPIPYANVVVLGSKLGTMTDENGNFLLVGVPVGKVQVQAQAIGYGILKQEVAIDAGAIAKVDFNFGQSAVVKQLEEIEVSAQRRIDLKSSTTKQSITAEKLRELPVDNLRDAIGTKAGVVAASDGLVAVCYRGRPMPGPGQSNLVDQRCAYSEDGGVSFGDEIVLGPASDIRFAAMVFPPGTKFLGDYAGVTVSDGVIHAAWARSSAMGLSMGRHQTIWSATILP